MAETGNPLFPYYGALFGFSEWSPEWSQGVPVDGNSGSDQILTVALEHTRSVLSGLGFLVLTPLYTLVRREIFHGLPPLSPWLVGLLPALAALYGLRFRRLSVSTHLQVLMMLSYCLFWLTTIRDLRFLLPVVPFLALAAAPSIVGGLKRVTPGLAQHSIRAALVLCLAPSWLYVAYRVVQQGVPPLTIDQSVAYLDDQLVGHRALRTAIEDATPEPGLEVKPAEPGQASTLYCVGGEWLRDAYPGRFLGDHFGPWRYHVLETHLDRPEELLTQLASWEVGYVMILRSWPRAARWQEALVDRTEVLWEDDQALVFRLPRNHLEAAAAGNTRPRN